MARDYLAGPLFYERLREMRNAHRGYQRRRYKSLSSAAEAISKVDGSTFRVTRAVAASAAELHAAVATSVEWDDFTSAKARAIQRSAQDSVILWRLRGAQGGDSHQVSLEDLDQIAIVWSNWFRGRIRETKGSNLSRTEKKRQRRAARRRLDDVLCGLNHARLAAAGRSDESAIIAGWLVALPTSLDDD